MTFPKYPEYKDTGVEWLGEVPAHWGLTRIKYSIRSLEQGWSPQCLSTPAGDDEWGVLKVGCVNGGDLDPAENKALPSELSPIPELGIRKGDLLISRANTMGLVGSAAVSPSNFPRLMLCDKLYRLRVNEAQHTPSYISDFLGTPQARSQIELDATGASSSMLNIGQSTIREMHLPAPLLKEQKAIAAFLKYEVGRIDFLLKEQKGLLDILKEKRDALVLTEMTRRSNQVLRLDAVAESIARPVQQKPNESYTAIGLFNRDRGLFHKEPRTIDQMGESDFFWVEEGDLILSGQFAWEGAVALAWKEDRGCVVSHRYPILRGKKGVANTEFLYAIFTTKHGDFLLNENSRGAAGRNRPLNLGSLLKETITVPPISVQEKICRLVCEERAIRREVASMVMLLLERRSALISAAVTGKIDVRGWQPPTGSTVPEATQTEVV